MVAVAVRPLVPTTKRRGVKLERECEHGMEGPEDAMPARIYSYDSPWSWFWSWSCLEQRIRCRIVALDKSLQKHAASWDLNAWTESCPFVEIKARCIQVYGHCAHRLNDFVSRHLGEPCDPNPTSLLASATSGPLPSSSQLAAMGSSDQTGVSLNINTPLQQHHHHRYLHRATQSRLPLLFRALGPLLNPWCCALPMPGA